MRVYSLSPAQIAEFYPFLRNMLIRACRSDDLGPGQLFEDALHSRATFWLAITGKTPKALIVTRIEQWPRAKVCRVLCASGSDMADWLETAMQTIERHARENGCKRLVTEGREGWSRVLGVAPCRFVFEKGIEA